MTWDRNRSLIAATVAIILLAIGIFALRREETVSVREALGDSTYDVYCSACKSEFKMRAIDYQRAPSSNDGVKCPKCGQLKVKNAADVSHDNPRLRDFDATKYTNVESLQAAMDAVGAQITTQRAKLDDPAIAKDNQQKAALQRELEVLYLKRNALDARWDELESQKHN